MFGMQRLPKYPPGRELVVLALSKALREIAGREGMGPIDYRDLATRTQVPVNLLDFVPDVSRLGEAVSGNCLRGLT